MNQADLIQEILRLKREKNVAILGHYYARPELQDLADFIGDSLALSHAARNLNATTLLFCGVHFMAETAKVISPEKRILTPTSYAGCSLAEGITGHDLKAWKDAHPKGIIVSYVNTTAEVKAYTDYCCTSANAVRVVEALPTDCPILFAPDRNLGAYVCARVGRKMDIWQAACFVHDRMDKATVQNALINNPEAELLIHPEALAASALEVTENPRCAVYSTTGILEHISRSEAKHFILATEPGILYAARRTNPGKQIEMLQPQNECFHMKQAGIWEVYEALRDDKYEVDVPTDIADRARLSIDRMMAIS